MLISVVEPPDRSRTHCSWAILYSVSVKAAIMFSDSAVQERKVQRWLDRDCTNQLIILERIIRTLYLKNRRRVTTRECLSYMLFALLQKQIYSLLSSLLQRSWLTMQSNFTSSSGNSGKITNFFCC